MHLDEQRFEAVHKLFLEASWMPEFWPAALDELAAAAGSTGACIIPFPSIDPVFPRSESIAGLLDDFIKGDWQLRNPRASKGAALFQRDPANLLRFHTDRDVFAADALAADPFYQEFLRPRGFQWFLGASLAEAEGRFVFLSVERGLRAEPYSPAEIERLSRLLLRLREAGNIALKLGVRADRQAGRILESLDCPAALLDRVGRPLACNGALEALLGDGICLKSGGRLAAVDRDCDKRLEEATSAVLRFGASSPRITLSRGAGRLPLIAEAIPIAGAARDVYSAARMLLLVNDPEARADADIDLLRQVFGLTPAEARLAARIATGASLEEIAAVLGVTVATARTQLRSVFAKTRTHRQSELAALITRLQTRLLSRGKF